MINPRKLRVIGLAAFSILLIVLLFRTHNSNVSSTNAGKAQTLLTSNNLVDSTNDEKLDAAINSEISKLGKEDGTNAIVDQDGKVKAPADPKKGTDKKKNQEAITEKGEAFDPAKELLSIRSLSPIVIFSKTFCPYSKKLKHLLKENYQITPEPTYVELDKHANGAELQAYLGEVTDRRTVPNVLVGSSAKSRGGSDDFTKFHEDGELVELLKKWGGSSVDVKKVEVPSNHK